VEAQSACPNEGERLAKLAGSEREPQCGRLSLVQKSSVFANDHGTFGSPRICDERRRGTEVIAAPFARSDPRKRAREKHAAHISPHGAS